MSKILIENYQGIDIEFDNAYEKFKCIITDELVKESISFSSVKKFIDDYIKTNQIFKPFWIDTIPDKYRTATLQIIGIRKDGRFIAKHIDGKQIQIPEYDLQYYMLQKEENKNALQILKELEVKEEKQRIDNNKYRKEIISTLNIVTLKDFVNNNPNLKI